MNHHLANRHLRLGWWLLAIFLALGILLEALHGFKVGWYLDVSNEARRLLFRLAHAHGTILGIVNIVFAFTLRHMDGTRGWQRLASPCLVGASVLLPAGFFLGGIVIYGSDPGLGILLVPAGALLLLIAVAITGWNAAIAEEPREEASGSGRSKPRGGRS